MNKNVKVTNIDSYSEVIDEIFESPYFKVMIGIYLDKKKAEKTIQKASEKKVENDDIDALIDSAGNETTEDASETVA